MNTRETEDIPMSLKISIMTLMLGYLTANKTFSKCKASYAININIQLFETQIPLFKNYLKLKSQISQNKKIHNQSLFHVINLTPVDFDFLREIRILNFEFWSF